jgi:hypothetical protein
VPSTAYAFCSDSPDDNNTNEKRTIAVRDPNFKELIFEKDLLQENVLVILTISHISITNCKMYLR